MTYTTSTLSKLPNGDFFETSTLSKLPNGDFFRRLRNGKPFGPMLMKQRYDRSEARYECSNEEDISDYRYLKGTLVVAIGETY